MNYEKINMGPYNIHFINTDKFKTTTISINFRDKIKKEEITIRKFLFKMLTATSLKYNTRRLLKIKLEDLYSLSLNESTIKFGHIINSYIDVKFLDEKYSDSNLIDSSLDMLFELIFNPNVKNNKFDSKIFKTIYDELNLSINSLKENPSMYSTINALHAMDNNDPLSYSLWGYKEDLDNISEESLYEYYKKVLKTNKIDIFIVGNFNKDKVLNIFKEKFNINTMKMEKFDPYITYLKCDKEMKSNELMQYLKQSKLTIICKVLNITTFERRYVMPLYASILGGDASSRLFTNVREKESLAYTVNASTKGPNSILLINAGINKENYNKTIKIIKNELKSMKKVTDLELENAKSDIVSTLNSLFDNSSGIINYYFGIEVFNADNILEKKKNYMKVTKKDITTFSNKIKIAMIYLLEGDNYEE